MKKIYFCIDLKTFYASVECVERGLDPFLTDLVVADPSRGKGAICLAISPKMKARGIRNRCRIYEIPQNISYITAMPRMKKYIEYSANIYEIYLKYFSSEDVHVYSIDECFIDITAYLSLYGISPFELAQTVMDDIYQTYGITATTGIGTNLYLAKVALDIKAKYIKQHIAFLDEDKYQRELWHHLPLTDFWQIGKGIEKRLNALQLYDMYDVTRCPEHILFQEFGVNARLLIDHAYGIEPVTMQEIKNYIPKQHSISQSQILFENYSFAQTRIVVTEMVDAGSLELINQGIVAKVIYLKIGYSQKKYRSTGGTRQLDRPTNLYSSLLKSFLQLYDDTTIQDIPIRRVSLGFAQTSSLHFQQLDLFHSPQKDDEEVKLEQTINAIKNKYGKNAILKANSYQKKATAKMRNKLIGGHNAE